MSSPLEDLRVAQDLFHEQLILDLCIRTLEVDKKKLDKLKMSRPIVRWYEHQIEVMWKERKDVKQKLANLGGKGELTGSKDGELHMYGLMFRGHAYALRYHPIALKNHVENEMLKRLGLEEEQIEEK